jgi:hypothetical protein
VGKFADAVSQFAVKVDSRSNHLVQAVAIELLNRVVLRSPVGNPELWASNAAANLWNRGASEVNAELRLNAANLTKSGRLKRGLKIHPKALTSAEGYVGGRFRGNWQVTIGSVPAGPVDLIDANGGPTIARGAAELAGFKAGPTIYLTNNVPYAIPLEYGHSTQAPAGVVRITVAEFQQIVEEQARSIPE